jgi:putative DNA modification/repair radical SAM protein
MDLGEKLSILASSAKYDASCASSGSGAGEGRKQRFGANLPSGVCHSWTGDGRCVGLLKVLYSNVCRFDCAYCVNRASADTERSAFTVDELVDLTCQFYRRNYIEGLFLSSGIFTDPDMVMEKLIAVAKKLRTEAGFGGYIHLKIIPGSGEKMIREAGLWADRLSANIELPTDKSLQTLAPQKSGKVIFAAMEDVSRSSAENEEDRRTIRRSFPQKLRTTPVFAPAGQSTQLIVGASEEDDRTIIGLSGALYRKFSMRRVYYSAFIPVGGPGRGGARDPRLPDISGPPLAREHRLYQADWLMRFYHFSPGEILEDAPYLDQRVDPKTAWALRHIDRFPIDVLKADQEELLRVPGIGATSARRILEVRRLRSLSFDSLRRLGIILKRARYFVTLGGSFIDRPDDPIRIRRLLSDQDGAGLQPPLFDF